MRNVSSHPLWSSWCISLLISYTSNEEYKQKSSVELLVYSFTDFICLHQEYKQKPSMELLVHCLTGLMNISRSPLWSSLIISLLISWTFNKEYEQKLSVELLVYFLTDFICFQYEYMQKPSVDLLVHCLTGFMNIIRSPLRSSWIISLLISYTFNKECEQKSSVELMVYVLTDFMFPQME